MSHHPRQSSTTAERRLQRLVEANRLVVAELSLDVLLPRIVEAARQIVEAEYAGLGVIGVDGTLEQFTSPDLDGSAAAAAGEPAKGRGLLTALHGTAETVRLRSLAADPRFSSVAFAQPAITTFLAVPIRSSGSTCGNLYLANRLGEAEFNAEDEYLLTAFAATAGVAMENARLYTEAGRRQEWLEASAEVGHQLLAAGTDAGVLEQIAESVTRLAEADTVQIVLPVPHLQDTLEFAVSKGPGAEHARGLRYGAAGSIAWEAMHHPGSLVLEDLQDRLHSYPDARSQLPITNLMAFPLRGAGQPRGCVVVCRSNGKPFTRAEVGMAESFTNQAALALGLADARADRSRLGQLEDRSRIARHLQHQVLQKLFDASLAIQGASTMTSNPALRSRLTSTITTLDDTIGNIRSSIFGLQPP
jgi:GAF domain-containing protein